MINFSTHSAPCFGEPSSVDWRLQYFGVVLVALVGRICEKSEAQGRIDLKIVCETETSVFKAETSTPSLFPGISVKWYVFEVR
jgi:hypothetical protein